MNKQLQNIKWEHVLPYLPKKEIRTLKLGEWEDGEFRTLEKYPLSRDDSVLELGACTGILAAHVNSIIDGSHLVVEANPEMMPCIEQTKKANNCDFDILNCVAGPSGSTTLYINEFRLSSSIAVPQQAGGFKPVTVESVSLSDLNPSEKFNVLICDIEGGEYDLRDQFPAEFARFEKIYIETHKNRKSLYKGGWRRHRNFLRFMKKTHKVIQVSGWSHQYYMERK
jgi:FkbM family methyltransferase